jgi:hypothetical protein
MPWGVRVKTSPFGLESAIIRELQRLGSPNACNFFWLIVESTTAKNGRFLGEEIKLLRCFGVLALIPKRLRVLRCCRDFHPDRSGEEAEIKSLRVSQDLRTERSGGNS